MSEQNHYKDSRSPVIEVTGTHLIECGYTRKHVNEVLPTLTIVRRLGRARYYDLCAAIRALNQTEVKADPDTRKKIAQAELAEEKTRRMKGESVNRIDVRNAWIGVLTRFRDAIKASEIPTLKDKRNLCRMLRTEIERADGELNACAFYDQDEDE